MSIKSAKIPVASHMLKWARETAGYSLEQIAKSKEFKNLPDWEEGLTYPTYFQLEALAEKYKRPVALFFFPTPPDEEPIEKSLRSMPGVHINALHSEIRFLFRKAKSFQIYLRELLSDQVAEQNHKLKWLDQDVHQSAEKLANHVRKALDITVETQAGWKDSEYALEEWRKLLAKHGVYVFKAAFKDDRVSGFCISDNIFPIIYLNNSQTKNRQIFTLFHEVGHLLFKENYLDVLDESRWSFDEKEDTNIETKCDAFAGHFLIPNSDFKTKLSVDMDNSSTLQRLADTYKVSKEAILLKLLHCKAIQKMDYEKKVKELKEQFATYAQKKPKSGGNFFNTRLAYLGSAYPLLIFERYYQGKINQEQASEYLDIKAKSFSSLEEAYFKRELSHVRV